MLPHHVETLGRTLDDVDIVDTPAVSIGAYGRIALGLLNSGNAAQRQLLLEERYKGLFDILAHRKEAYLTHAAGWASPPDRRVGALLKAFAADPGSRWTTLQRATALSFHGAERAGFAGERRRDELNAWSARLSPAIEQYVRASGNYCSHGSYYFGAVHDRGVGDRQVLWIILGSIQSAT